jgi:protein-disulfide isomerase
MTHATQLTVPVRAEDHVQGTATAAVTLVEYGDYQCPYCGAAHPLVKQLQQQFAGDLRFVFRNFPLTQAHPLAQMAAELAEAAGFQDKFWPMHDWIYENQ